MRKKTHEEFVVEVEALVGDEYTVESKYTNARTKLFIKHNNCGNIYEVCPDKFLRGRRCPKCAIPGRAKKQRKTHNHFVEEIAGMFNGEYLVLSKYETAIKKVAIKHLSCGHLYKVKPNNILSGFGCPRCNLSKGEMAIGGFLKSNEIRFTFQKRFHDCRDRRYLPFDVAIFYRNRLISLVEYDGEQHYIAKNFFGGESALLETQRRDAIKTKYCEDNGIPLIRIPYWKFDEIDEILTRELLPLINKSNAS